MTGRYYEDRDVIYHPSMLPYVSGEYDDSVEPDSPAEYITCPPSGQLSMTSQLSSVTSDRDFYTPPRCPSERNVARLQEDIAQEVARFLAEPDFDLRSLDLTSQYTAAESYSSGASHVSVLREKKRCLGLLCAILSAFLFSVVQTYMKRLSYINQLNRATLYLSMFMLMTLPVIICRSISPHSKYLFPRSGRKLLVIRAAAGVIVYMLRLFAYQITPRTDATFTLFCVPIFAVLFARIFLKEPCSVFIMVCIALVIVGGVILVWPTISFENDEETGIHWFSPIFIFVHAILTAGIYVMLRKLQSLPLEVILFQYGLIGTSVLGTSTLIVHRGMCVLECGNDRYLFAFLAVLSFGTELFLTLAFKWEDAGPVSIILTTYVLFAFMWQTALGEDFVWRAETSMGTLLVAAAVVAMFLRELGYDIPGATTQDKLDRIRCRMFALKKDKRISYGL